MDETTSAHLLISGRVQGVNFRWSTQREARAAGLAGWVRNLDDGRVEAVFEGPQGAVQRLVQWCHHGPSYARVEHVDVDWPPATGMQGFSVR